MRYTWRFYTIVTLFFLVFLTLMYRVYDLAVLQHDFLLDESEKRSLRMENVAAHRSMLLDREGEPLAISIPAVSVWINPSEIKEFQHYPWDMLAKAMGISSISLRAKIERYRHKQFVYLKRRLPPEQAEAFKGLQAVHQKQEFKRFYPQGAMAAHWVGITNIDDQGIDGAELLFDQELTGVHGASLVVRDREGAIVKRLKELQIAEPGSSIALSMDARVQWVAYKALLEALSTAHAESGSVVVVKVKTGEVLAMANAPSYNPNRPIRCDNQCNRNRAISDMFEPGSTMKAFSALVALESGLYSLDSVIDTGNGTMKIDKHVISDHGKAFGEITLQDILVKSSNIGIAKVAMSLPDTTLYHELFRLGFGASTLLGLPGETAGRLVQPQPITPAHIASLSYGYGVAASSMQLAQAYSILANDGVRVPLTIIKQDQSDLIKGERIYSSDHVKALLSALNHAASDGGTASKAKVPGYLVAGKTGTAYIAGANGYDQNDRHYVSSFAGLIPYPDPELVIIVTIRDPKKGHYGGQVAAPVFAKVASHAMPFYDRGLLREPSQKEVAQ